MEGRNHTGIMFTMNGCKDPGQEASWNTWYNTTHRNDMLKHGVFTQMTRFKKIDGLAPAAEPMYLAIYETSKPDPLAAYPEQREKSKANPPQLHPALASGTAAVVKLHKTYGGDGKGKRATGVVIAQVQAKDPALDAQFNEWYDRDHGREVVAAGGFYTASRYINADPKPGQAKNIVVYETDANDPAKAQVGIREHGRGMVPSPMPLEVVTFAVYRRI